MGNPWFGPWLSPMAVVSHGTPRKKPNSVHHSQLWHLESTTSDDDDELRPTTNFFHLPLANVRICPTLRRKNGRMLR